MIDRVWREGATAEELAEIAALDEELARLSAVRLQVMHERAVVKNRACQRARYWRKQSHAASEKMLDSSAALP